jgi:hypothetical protein
MTFKNYYNLLESNFSIFPGKLESRKKEFNFLGATLKNISKNNITTFSLPAGYAYESYLANFTSKKVISFGTDLNISSLFQRARVVSETGVVIPYIVRNSTDIDDIIDNPAGYSFFKIIPEGMTDEIKHLPEDIDIIDLDYTGMPFIQKFPVDGKTPTGRSVKIIPSSFEKVNKAGKLLKPGGLLCVTFLLYMRGQGFFNVTKNRDPLYHSTYSQKEPDKDDYFNINTPDPDVFAAIKMKSFKQGPTAMYRYKLHAKAANEYIFQIVNNEYTDLKVVWSNMYKGGETGNSIMWRGVFKKR